MLGTEFLGDCHLDNPVNLNRINHSIIEDLLYSIDEDIAEEIIDYDEVSDIATIIKDTLVQQNRAIKMQGIYICEKDVFDEVLEQTCLEFIEQYREDE